jgi:cold shock CspA family protein
MTESEELNCTQHGIVKFFDLEKGFGYIKSPDTGGDIYVHRSAIVSHGSKYLVSGERVMFELAWDSKRSQRTARAVRPASARHQGRVVAFQPLKGYGLIMKDGEDRRIFVHHSDILGQEGRKVLELHERVSFELTTSPDGRLQAINVKRADPRPPLLRFAHVGRMDRWLQALADLAEPEPWDYFQTQSPRHTILRSYIFNTFDRLEQEDSDRDENKKIALGSNDGQLRTCFNTGLVTMKEEGIYGLFDQNPFANTTSIAWRLIGFFVESSRQLLESFKTLPEPAQYWDDPADLIFDPRRKLTIDYDHIVGDHLQRFPEVVRGNPQMAHAMLTSAQELAVRLSRRNFRIAIPQYHRSEIQLLLPLCFTDPHNADLALVISRIDEGYRGNTVLTLEMAYNNARLLGRFEDSWSRPL